MTKPLSKEAYDAKWLDRVRSNALRLPADKLPIGCLISAMHRTHNGYAETCYRGTTVRVHRQLFKLANGIDLPASIDVCHKCDMRACIEETHLWAGTRKQNLIDCLEKGRHYRDTLQECKHGHPFTPENTEIRKSGPRPGAGRACKACARIRLRKKLGWTDEEARTTPVIPAGQKTKRRSFVFTRAGNPDGR